MHNPWPLAFKAQFESEDEKGREVINFRTYIPHSNRLNYKKEHKNKFNLKTKQPDILAPRLPKHLEDYTQLN